MLVDALGLSAFEPRRSGSRCSLPQQPTAGSTTVFMDFCAFDLDLVRERVGVGGDASQPTPSNWPAPRVQAAMGDLIGQFAATPIPPAELARITVPTTLIWGRHDLATQSRSPRRSEPGTAGRCTSSRTPVMTRPSSNPRRSWTRIARRDRHPDRRPDRRGGRVMTATAIPKSPDGTATPSAEPGAA